MELFLFSLLFRTLVGNFDMAKKRLIVLSGAGMSAESGIKTFRDSNGLWEEHRVEDVASPEGWRRNPQLVLDFYNARRKQLLECEPNEAHRTLVKLEDYFDVRVITQNVDDLHERAGSKNVLHLHGELRKARSTADESLVYDWDKDIRLGDVCGKSSQLRPCIVWFGEDVPMITKAAFEVQRADVLLIIGTSLQVYPAAGLAEYAPHFIPKYYIDPKAEEVFTSYGIIAIPEKATVGLKKVWDELLDLA